MMHDKSAIQNDENKGRRSNHHHLDKRRRQNSDNKERAQD
jgi:hypothetical protein